MRKVIIMTSQESFHNNYGAALQGYALYQTIMDIGYSPAIVKYRGGQFPTGGKSEKYFYTKRFFSRAYHKLVKTPEEKKHASIVKKYKIEIEKRESLFHSFANENMTYWSEKSVEWRDLKKNCPLADYYVCGSDQIWNPYFKYGENDPGYFLAFAPESSIKIAYAPSFGCSDIPSTAQTTLKQYLKTFSAISVREKSGVDIIKKYTELDSKWVLDPTLLRTPEQWKAISRMPKDVPEKYILCYRFADSEATRNAISNASESLGLPVISLPLSDVSLEDNDRFIFDAGPREFVGLIQNASLVCTDSFHATVFSLLMKTPVCVFLRENYISGNSMNSRVYSLLEMFGLQNLIKTEADSDYKVLDALNVDYTQAHTLLDKYREESLVYLSNSFKTEV